MRYFLCLDYGDLYRAGYKNVGFYDKDFEDDPWRDITPMWCLNDFLDHRNGFKEITKAEADDFLAESKKK